MAGMQLFSLSFQPCGSRRPQGTDVKVSRGLELHPGGLQTSVGLSPEPQGSVCTEVRNKGALGP